MARRAFSRGIEKVILLAALDREFGGRLLADREAALESCEVELTDSERAILTGIPDDRLIDAVERIPIPDSTRRTFLQRVAAGAGVIALLGSILATGSCSYEIEKPPAQEESQGSSVEITVTLGIRPDRQEPVIEEPLEESGDGGEAPEPEPPPRPDPTRGSRPDRDFMPRDSWK